MKKSLLALAVLGAFAGAASAQSSVTVYGIVDTGIASVDVNNGGDRVTGLASGMQSPSRIGFKGTEDLGGGLAATFQLESGFSSDTGALATDNQLFSRISTVGLQGAFGKVDLGRQTTLLKDAHDQIDPFGGSGGLGNISKIFYNGAGAVPGLNTTGTVAGVTDRNSNSVKWSSNNYAGFKGGVSYAFGEAVGDTTSGSQWALNLGYNNGPLNVQGAYLNQNRETGVAATAGAEVKIAFIGATYNFGAFKLHGAYADTKYDGSIASNKFRNGMIGVSLPLGPGSLAATYAINDNRTIDNADSKLAAIQYSYDLSKRTNVYAGYSRTNNDSGVTNALGLGSVTGLTNTVGAGQDVSIVAVGLRHKF